MSIAYCFSCGSEKTSVISSCGSCQKTPTTESDLVRSLILSDEISTRAQLVHFAHEVRTRLHLSAPDSLVAKARAAASDPKYQRLLIGSRSASPPTSTNVRQAPAPTPVAISHSMKRRSLSTTKLHMNAFALLGANPRDDRRRIVELAEERSLEIDHELCQKARSDLTNPRNRLSVEMAWLPGVSPARARGLLGQLLSDPISIRNESGLPDLAFANLLAAVFESVGATDSAKNIAEFIEQMADHVEYLDPDDVLRDINEDRLISGFPEASSTDQIEAELIERRRYYRNAIKEALDRMAPTDLVEAMTITVDSATVGGEIHAPNLIDELVDSYTLESQEFLTREADNAEKLIKAISSGVKSGESAIASHVAKLERVVRSWSSVARPVQLSAKARGLDHDGSKELAYSIRSLAIDLFNEHDMLVTSQKLTALLEDQFSEIPEFAERVSADAETLGDIAKRRKAAAEEKKKWDEEITFSAEVGLVFKDTLAISPVGVSWKDRTYPLESITRVRWGGVRNSVNGVPTGTDYTVAFGDNRSEQVIQIKREWVYKKFTDRLWRAVGVKIMTDMLNSLKAGEEVRVGDAVIHDDSIVLVKHKFFGSNELARVPWSQTHIWSADGSFYIGAKDDKKTYAGLSYISTANAHVVEQIIRVAFKKPGLTRLSQIFD
jgi:hypothetical protein